MTKEIWAENTKKFREYFSDRGQLTWVAAPGRVNLIGEHTDYHEGFVLPAAIDRHVRLLARPRTRQTVRLYSATFKEEWSFNLDDPMTHKHNWARRAEGVIRRVLENARKPRGMDVWLDADLPSGAGLSSSAASMAALALLAANYNEITIETVSLAKLLQAAEHKYAGVKCGIMDQLAVLNGRKDHALWLDCRSLDMQQVALPTAWQLVIMDTGVKRDLAASEYNKRQLECASVLELIKQRRPEVSALRDVTPTDLEAVRQAADATGLRRCRHVLAENERVQQTAAALGQADAAKVKRLFHDSQASLRDDYQVSCPELDALVEAAGHAPGGIAARMTGGGFGGSTVNFVERGRTAEFINSVSEQYQRKIGKAPAGIVTGAVAGCAIGLLEQR